MVVLFASLGRKLHANAEGDSEELVDPPKVEEKIGAVPNGLSTDADVAKRFLIRGFDLFFFVLFVILYGFSKKYIFFNCSGSPSQCQGRHSAVMRRSSSFRLRCLDLWTSS